MENEKSENKKITMNVMVSPFLRERIERLSAHRKESLSETVRYFLESEAERQERLLGISLRSNSVVIPEPEWQPTEIIVENELYALHAEFIDASRRGEVRAGTETFHKYSGSEVLVQWNGRRIKIFSDRSPAVVQAESGKLAQLIYYNQAFSVDDFDLEKADIKAKN
jgi:hypothetical protein